METETIPQATLSTPIRGLHLTGATLDEELEKGPQLLVFLRHLG